MIFIPYLLSCLLGCLLFRMLAGKETTNVFLSSILSLGLGLGLSSHLTFYSYVIFDNLNKTFVIAAHLILIAILFFLNRSSFHKPSFNFSFYKNPRAWLAIAVFITILIPLWMQARFYPFGGWDAWSCWNLKAKFLFLGNEEWKNIFDPALWRASPHYPLLLPLMSVWGWIFTKTPTYSVPLTNALIFTLLTAGLLFSALKIYSNTLLATISTLLIVTLPFFVKLAVSQYSDVVLSFYLFAALFCLFLSYTNENKKFILLSGLFLGFLTFTKPEGTVAGILLVLSSFIYLFLEKRKSKNLRKTFLIYFFIGIFMSILPTVLFQILYAPANQTFINGFTSLTHPITHSRIKITSMFFLIEPISDKWHGIWILLLGGLFLTKGKCLERDTRIFPMFLLIYLGVIFAYYLLNTYFEISWWLSVTFNRILFSLLPIVLFWVFYSLDKAAPKAKT